MSLFSKLFGGNDPTKDWPVATGPAPRVSLERKALETFGGRLTFGEPLESARALGRPERCKAGEGYATLEYEKWGLTVEFEQGRFVQATFAIGDSIIGASGEALGPDGLSLTGRTTKDEVLQRFGQPGKIQALDEETIFYYTEGPLTSEFQFDEDGLLFGWDVYLD